MSTLFDPAAHPPGRPRATAAGRRAPRAVPPQVRDRQRGAVARANAHIRAPAPGGRRLSSRLPRWRLSAPRHWRPEGAGLFAVATLFLSLLGLMYLIQINQVARSGYRLIEIQRRYATVERENQLLLYQLSTERGLARVGEVARDYGMRPLTPLGAGTGGPVEGAAGAKPAGPRHQFAGVQRPATPAPTPAPARGGRDLLLDRLWGRLVGLGAARGPERGQE